MKITPFKIFLITFACFVIGITGLISYQYFAVENRANAGNDALDEQEDLNASTVFTEALKPIYGEPKIIVVGVNKINAKIIDLGLDETGALETPKEWTSAGWYRKSAKPGETGNMIIDGHYDDSRGRPAAFWQLKNVIVDDKVTVTDSFGRIYTYKVIDSYFISINDPDRLKVLESHDNDKATLTLITCGGVWVPGKSTYDKRLVVKAELINEL